MRRTRTGLATYHRHHREARAINAQPKAFAPTNVMLTGYEYIAKTAQRAINGYTVPMTLHLDHGKTLDDVRQDVNAGFTSIMIDGAALPFEENIRLSLAKRWVGVVGQHAHDPVEDIRIHPLTAKRAVHVEDVLEARGHRADAHE